MSFVYVFNLDSSIKACELKSQYGHFAQHHGK